MEAIINKKLPLPAEYKEKIKVTEVDHDNSEFFEGFIPFTYDVLEYAQEEYSPIQGMSKTRSIKIIKTYDSLPFKIGDVIRIWGNELYKIKSVTFDIEERFKKTVARFPNAWKKYAYKRILLK